MTTILCLKSDFQDEIKATFYKTFQQIEDSQNIILGLIDECNEMVTNIRIANDLREINRRKEKKNLEIKKANYLKIEDMKAKQLLNEINEKWDVISKFNDSIDIYNASEEQRKRCKKLIENRNNIIETLSKDLVKEDERFITDQITQRNDINILSYRINHQIEILRNEYRKHLRIVEETILDERKTLLDNYQKEWENLNCKFENQEVQNVNDRFKMIETYEKEIDEMYDEHYEKFNSLKENLEKQLQDMQISFEKTTAACLLKEKKLEYNYLVLTQRQKELSQVKSEQKQKINRLRNNYAKIHKKVKDAQDKFLTIDKRLQHEINQLKSDFQRNINKMGRMNEINENLFKKIWDLNRERCATLIKELFRINKQLHQELLQVDWKEPELQFMKISELPSVQLANQLSMKDAVVKETLKDESFTGEILSPKISLDTEITKFILREVAKGTRLLNRHVSELTKDLPSSQQNLINYNSILKALKIRNRFEIELLNHSVISHIKCITCNRSQNTKKKQTFSMPYKQKSYPHIERKFSLSKLPSSASQLKHQYAEKKNDCQITFTCRNSQHLWKIDELELMNVISNFIKNLKQERKRRNSDSHKKILLHRILMKQDMDIFWERIFSTVSKIDESNWNVIQKFLNDYLKILQVRNSVEQELKCLEKQNAELKHLLSQFPNKTKHIDK